MKNSENKKRRLPPGSTVVVWALSGLLAVWFLIVPIGLGVWSLWLRKPAISPTDLATLMKAIPGLWWPLLLVVALVLFRSDLAALLHRLRRWSGFGNTLELDAERVEALERNVKEAKAEQSAERSAEPQPASPEPQPRASGVTLDSDELFRLASQDPRLAVARLAMEMEREISKVATELGMDERLSVQRVWTRLARIGLVGPATLASLTNFWAVRNEVIHGRNVELTRDALAGLLDSGLTLLGIVKTIPSRIYTVVRIVDVFTDAEGFYMADDVKGVFLRSGGENPEESGPFPTTRLYKPGTEVSWAWNPERRFGTYWYREGDDMKKAWDRSFEFVGSELRTRWPDKGIHPGLLPDDEMGWPDYPITGRPPM